MLIQSSTYICLYIYIEPIQSGTRGSMVQHALIFLCVCEYIYNYTYYMIRLRYYMCMWNQQHYRRRVCWLLFLFLLFPLLLLYMRAYLLAHMFPHVCGIFQIIIHFVAFFYCCCDFVCRIYFFIGHTFANVHK